MYSITIAEALQQGRERSVCCPEHRKNLEQLGRIVENFATTRLKLDTFCDLKIHHVLALVRHMQEQEHSPSYIRHAVNTVRLASNYMSDYHGLAPIKIEQRHLPERLEAPKMWLGYHQIAKACQIAMQPELRQQVDNPRSNPQPMELARVIMLVCGLCGVRIKEFCRLTTDSLDTGNNLTITESKNESSNRVIPIPAITAQAMREYWSKRGNWSTDRTSNAKRVRLLYQLASNVTDDDIYLLVAPKDLRKTLVNELFEDVNDPFIMAYCGWAFKGTMHRKYLHLTPKPNDPAQIKQVALDRLRRRVVDVIEEKITGMSF